MGPRSQPPFSRHAGSIFGLRGHGHLCRCSSPPGIKPPGSECCDLARRPSMAGMARPLEAVSRSSRGSRDRRWMIVVSRVPLLEALRVGLLAGAA